MDDPRNDELDRARQLVVTHALIDHTIKTIRALSSPYVSRQQHYRRNMFTSAAPVVYFRAGELSARMAHGGA